MDSAKQAFKDRLNVALQKLSKISKSEPHRAFFLCLVPCPYCRRHAVSFRIQSQDGDEKRKYTIAIGANGLVLTRTRKV